MAEIALAHEVASKLQTAIGVTEEQLRDAVKKGLDAQLRCTRLHPPSAPGYYRWAEGTVALRQTLRPQGWKADDSGNLSSVVRPDGLVQIVIATGDSRTAKPGIPVPTTKYPRGPRTRAAVQRNNQLQLDVVSGATILPDDGPRCVSWWLLVAGGHEWVRMELSCPSHINELNYIDSWSDRIFLEPLDIEGTIDLDPEEQAMEFDVPVQRRR
jgi:hypothetical protein